MLSLYTFIQSKLYINGSSIVDTLQYNFANGFLPGFKVNHALTKTDMQLLNLMVPCIGIPEVVTVDFDEVDKFPKACIFVFFSRH